MKFSYVSLMIGALLGTQALAQDFSQMVIFGDSLSDTGRLKDIVTQVNPTFGNALQESFTTNPDPVWTRVLASNLGTKADANTTANPAGTNYAVGGARSGSEVNWNGVISVPSTSKQIGTYLGQHQNKADPNALYAVWIGSNDLIAAAQAGSTNEALAAISSSAQATYQDILTLHQAGAKYVLVPNVPDISLTPRVLFAEKVLGLTGTAQKARTAAKLYNDKLYQQLNQSNINVIPANTFGLLQEVAGNPTDFGFKNISSVACQMPNRTTGADDPLSTSLACTPANLVAADANETHLFADDIHPAGRTHRILAQYYQSIIDAPAAMAKLTNVVTDDGQRFGQKLYQQMNTLTDGQANWWIDGDVAKLDNGLISSQGTPTTVAVGASFATDNGHIGAYAKHGQHQYTLSPTTKADIDQTGVGVYAKQTFGKAIINAQAGVSRLDAKTDRSIAWEGQARHHQAWGHGSHTHAGLRVAYQLGSDKLNYRPYVEVLAQQVVIKDLVEDQSHLATAMRFDTQEHNSLQGELGVAADYQLNDKIAINAGVGYTHEFHDDDRQIGASLTSLPYTKGFVLPTTKDKNDGIYAHLGANARLTASTSLNLGVLASRADDKHGVGGFIGLQGVF
ncbi:autotransporter domain-containing protein [Moraxella sp.]|uniref:autotransporter domain-containing protein n=1 Tax=Moraxella sp. TaxID=479 RepID=UPI0026DCE88A|nr:autotransporter domain-containing protein [Moraxella sp.]MDO4894884.1 autotransporter domain-containing protein [Moraxella sp.]